MATTPLPRDYGISAADGLRVDATHRTMIGGVPLRILRLAPGAFERAQRLLGGELVADELDGRVARTLVDAAAAHPLPPSDATPPNYDIVVPTTDATHQPVIERSIVEHDPDRTGPAATRNRGAARGTADVIVFVDDDATIDKASIDALLRHFADPDVAAAAPRVRSSRIAVRHQRDSPSVIDNYETVRSPLDMGDRPGNVRPGGAPSYVPAAVLAVRRSAFDAVGGFDENLRFGEDVDLIWRLVGAGGSVRYEPTVQAGHANRRGLMAFARQRVGYGSSAASLHSRHGDAVAPLRVHGWSAAVWSVAALARGRGRLLALLPLAISLWRFRREIGEHAEDPRVAVRLGLTGHANAGRWVAHAARREWWPILAVASVFSRRAQVTALAALLPVAVDWVQQRPKLDPLQWTALHLVDDLSYGVGVWRGCATERTLGPLLPVTVSRSSGRGEDPTH